MAPRRKLETIVSNGKSTTAGKRGTSPSADVADNNPASDGDVSRPTSSHTSSVTEPTPSPTTIEDGTQNTQQANVTDDIIFNQSSLNLTVNEVRKLLHEKGLLDGELPERFREILMWHDPDTQSFSVHRLPMSLVWEKTVNHKTTASNVMHVQGASEPCIMWILGEVVNPWFFDSQGQPMKIPSITVTPILPATLPVVKRLLGTVFAPPANSNNSENSNLLRASTFSTERKRGVRAAEAVTLKNIYDATDSFDGYRVTGLNKRMDASFIATGDIVLLEVTISRYRDREAPTGNTWQKVLNIHSISLLVRSDM